jgi:hypothetical protein
MTAKEIFIALMIHLIFPLIGLVYFIKLKKQMKDENIEKAPIIELFLIFVTYGGLLLVSLTSLFWKWSGLASLGSLYLIIGSPIVMSIIMSKFKYLRATSKYHNLTYIASLLYFIIAPLIILVLYFIT